ncbi:MAG: PAS domain S-box protein [Caldilineaceae bacterium]|nr:PAS domain S-box protein [Caldilineaceae bacterium]
MKPVTRILYVDDSPLDRELVRDALENEHGGFEVVEAASQAEFEARLAEGGYDLVVSDFNILGFEGLQVMETVHEQLPGVPVVIVTGTGSEEIAVEAMKRGVADYVIKSPDHIRRLPRTLHTVLENMRLHAERQRADEQIRYQAALLEQVSDAIVSTDPDFVIRTWNKGAEVIYGWRAAEVIGRPFPQMIPTSFPNGDREQVLQQFRAEGSWKGEVIQQRKDGTPLNILSSASLLRDEAGNVTGALVVNRDITERKRVEDALRERLKEITCLYAIRRDMGLALTPAELCQRIVEYLIPAMQFPELAAPVVQLGGQQYTTGHYSPELRHNLRAEIIVDEKRLGYVQVFYRQDKPFIIPEEQELLDAVAEHLRMWLERRRAGEALRQSEAYFRSLVENVSDMISVTDADAVIRYVNPACTRILGFAPEELIGRHALELVHEDDQPKINEMFVQHGAASGLDAAIEVRNRHKDDSWRTLEVQAKVVADTHGELVSVITARDITERKQAEIALQRQLNELTVLHAVALTGASATNPDELIESVTQTIGEALYPDHFGVLLIDERQEFLHPHRSYRGVSEEILTRWQRVPIGHGVAGKVAATGKPLLLADVRQYENYLNVTASTRAELCVPIKVDERVIGVINAESDQPGFFTQDDQRLLLTIAGQLATAIEKLRLFAETRRRVEELGTIAQVSSALRVASNRAEMLPIILDQLLEVLHVDGAALEILDPATGDLHTELGRGIWEAVTGTLIPAGAGLSALVLADGQPYLNNAAQSDPRLFRPDLFGGCRAIAGAPLAIRDKIIGLLWIGSKRPLDDHDLRLLTAIANMAAGAIQRTTIFEQTQFQAEQIAQIIRSIPDGVLLLNEQYEIVVANPIAHKYLALLADAQVGDSLIRLGGLTLPDLLTSPPSGLWHEVQMENRVFEAIARPLVTGPTPAGWVVVLRDITEGQLVHRQLQRQERLAAIGQLAAGIAHDFNNLMGVIVLYAQLLSFSPGLSARDRERLTTINQQAERASDMIRQILDFSRRSVLERQPLDLLPLLKEQIKLLQRIVPEHIEIGWKSEADEYLVQADPTRMQQVIMNLAVNARDAMPHGGKLTFHLTRIHVNREQDQPLPGMEPGEWIQLIIADTGAGIPADIVDHVFEPFFTTKEPGKGTGLGLAQVHGIIAQHGGQITVDSRAGEGATFTIYLPALAIPKPVSPVDTPVATPPQGQGEWVLVVEDSDALRASLVDYLAMWNYRTLEAANGEEALACIHEQRRAVSLVLSDVVMPRMGGVALFHALRTQGYSIPVILMTGHPLDDEDLSALYTEGLIDQIAKPPDLARLAQSIVDALQQAR